MPSLCEQYAIQKMRNKYFTVFHIHIIYFQFNKVPVTNDPGAQTVTFRKMLLNKCQTEFEKESSHEMKLAEDRNKTFDTVSNISIIFHFTLHII